jgi:SAM-dependent methyltransferase
MVRRDLISVIEGFYLCHIIYYLYRSDALTALRVPTESHDLAASLNCDPDLLVALLEFAYQRTDMLRRGPTGKYQLSPQYMSHVKLGFQLDKFVGAYGPAFSQISEAVRRPDLGGTLIDSTRLAAAYEGLPARSPSIVGQILIARGIDSLLDLGCGPARLLVELGTADPGFRGWGIDANPAMCKIAERRIDQAQLSGRVRLIKGDVRNLDSVDLESAEEVSALHAGSLLNEFFRDGNSSAINFLGCLRARFPGGLLFVSDYFGKLTRVSRVPAGYRHSLLQDAAQAISGQGVPPSDLAGWIAVYDAAGCSILDAYQGETGGIDWFVHIVRLSRPAPPTP